MSQTRTPDRLGPYILRESLGYGPSGAVYRATDSDSGRDVSLKVVPLPPASEDDSLLRDLQATNAIHAAASLRHPGIVRVFRTDAIAGQAATETEYVRGLSLRDMLRIVGRMLPERAVAIACQILDALAYAHARRAVHADLKPNNILIRHDGLVKLRDFGFRGACSDPARVRASAVHCYAAPEQLDDESAADRRSDVWSVGTLVFQMLTGRLPFPISDPHDLRAWQRGVRAAPAAPIPDLLSGQSAPLRDALARALRVEPHERYQNAREFLNALLATGLVAGLGEEDEEEQSDRMEETCRRIDDHLRSSVDASEETALPELMRAFSQSNPDWEDSAVLLHYAGVLDSPQEPEKEPEPHAIALTPEEVDHLEEIESRLKSLLDPADLRDRAAESAPDAGEPPTIDRERSSVRDVRGSSAALGELEPGTMERDIERSMPPLRDPSTRPDGNSPDAESDVERPDAPHVTASETERSKPGAIAWPVNPRDNAELIFIPPGEFTMGSNGFSEDNAPERQVTLHGYYVYRNPVTVAQYRRYCEETAYPMPHAFWPWNELDPIVGVTWYEACSYCEWAGVRLPTEAEWEKAARGTDGRSYPWGEQFDQRSSHALIPANARRVAPVGRHPAGASPYGLLDAAGNVQQWCADLYDDAYYKSAPLVDPPGPVTAVLRRETKAGLVQRLFNPGAPQATGRGDHRVARGSSWSEYHESFAFTFRRAAFGPTQRLASLGFRCACDSVPEPRPGSES